MSKAINTVIPILNQSIISMANKTHPYQPK